MNADQLARQMQRDEALYSAAISTAITMALNSSATRKSAKALSGGFGVWPYPPTREILGLYRATASKAWSRIKSDYRDLDVTISVGTDSSNAPSATASVRHKGAFKGGRCHLVSKGETVVSIARATYGHEAYAVEVWQANAGVLGRACRQVPAGFGIDLPQIWVPDWKTPPKVSLPAGARSPAVKIARPTLKFDIEKSKSATRSHNFGAFSVDITFAVTGTLEVQEKGTVDASFDLRTYKAEAKKAAGPLSAGLSADAKEGSGSFSLTIKNSKVGGLKGVKSVTLKPGSVNITVCEKTVKYTHGNFSCSAAVKVTAEVRIRPNPVPVPVKPKVRVPKVNIRWDVVVGLVIVGGVVVVGSAMTGGTGTPALVGGAATVIVGMGLTGRGGGA